MDQSALGSRNSSMDRGTLHRRGAGCSSGLDCGISPGLSLLVFEPSSRHPDRSSVMMSFQTDTIRTCSARKTWVQHGSGDMRKAGGTNCTIKVPNT
ncbi:uncharacterized protein SEPMUDRAFT_149876 [Sphaerulina musiva SO2202]|uniref:Uncharacterized protein n=1 Tax=Sphaerulina musiva (strain SO2202) TaxID=692275 RepID=N1QI36_SPHMS|nr:uncharacterized protein SEPMUDRAFT_149876 [Sphaerulina musiva SO2202]EMF12114.1 hypothetical protein SEPMUDRAFT_149876 [Sphaerulina musiva SO2202]